MMKIAASCETHAVGIIPHFTGPIATAGFGLLDILWFYFTLTGYRAALARRFADHRLWMIRSYALTFGAVTLRLYLAVAIATQMDFAVAYRAISFLSWVPNLLLVEWWLRRRDRAGSPSATWLGRP